MISGIFAAFAVAVIFYLVLPLTGAFSVRRKWRRFRRLVVQASLADEVTYSNPSRGESGPAGNFSFTGELEAIQDDSSIWLSNGKVSVKAEMKGLRLYLLPTSSSIANEGRIEENKVILPQDMPKRISWERVYSLAQGTGVLLYGGVEVENGTPLFRNSEHNPLLAIIFDGDKETILRRSIWSGRQLNEYWNSITPLSLITGSFFLFVLTFITVRQARFDAEAIIMAMLSFVPVFPFIPPGIFLYFAFRRLWRAGRYARGERDLLNLPTRHPDYSTSDSCSVALADFSKAKIRSCSMIPEKELMERSCRVYTSGSLKSEGIPEHFFEHLIVPGDPSVLAEKCKSRARIMEILAAASMGLCFIINGLIIYLVLIWFM